MNTPATKKPSSAEDSPSGSSLPSTAARWKWMAGSTAAAGAAIANVSDAALVQITQTNNQVSNATGNTLQADLTGDGVADLVGLGGAANSNPNTYSTPGYVYYNFQGSAYAFSNFAYLGAARFSSRRTYNTVLSSTTNSYYNYGANVGGTGGYGYGPGPQSETGMIRIPFQDARINNGDLTGGLLEVRAFNTAFNMHTLQLVRLIFNDTSTGFPSGVAAGTSTKGAFDPTKGPQIASLEKKIERFEKKIDKLKAKGRKDKARKLKRKVRKLKAQLRNLNT